MIRILSAAFTRQKPGPLALGFSLFVCLAWLSPPLGAQDTPDIPSAVNPSNAAEILNLPEVDGALVGGASLKASDFLKIITAIKSL